MNGFAEVYAALVEGKHVRRARWDRGNKMYIRDGHLLWECHGHAKPHQLDWEDMSANDWSVV